MSQRAAAQSVIIDGVNPEVSGDGMTCTLAHDLCPEISSYRTIPYHRRSGSFGR